MKRFLLIAAGVIFSTSAAFGQTSNTVFPSQANEFAVEKLQTSGPHKFKGQFAEYEKLKSLVGENCGVLLYQAPHDGELKITSSAAQQEIQLAVFRAESKNFDQELNLGTAFLLAHKTLAQGQSLSVDPTTNDGLQETKRFQILKGQWILVFASSATPTTLTIIPELKKVKTLDARTKMDPFEFRKNKAGLTLKIVMRDAKTGFPVRSRVNIQGLKGLENIFNGSDLTFDLVTTKGATFACDAEGYFKTDVSPKLVAGVDNIITILMNPYDINENMRLDGVQFIEGTCEPLPSAFKDLDKLVNFMKVNPSIRIEVQGHVNAPDKGSRAAEKLSLTRAKYVRDYLVKNGIDKDRIEFVGYGSTMMIYENPKNEQEEQANRRVEIKIFE